MGRIVILFDSMSQVFQAEKLLKAEVIVKLIPIPRSFSSDCGICILCDKQDEVRVKRIF